MFIKTIKPIRIRTEQLLRIQRSKKLGKGYTTERRAKLRGYASSYC